MVPGVPNYNAGQDVGSPEWLNTTNDLRNVRRWWTTEQSYGSLAALVPPGPGPLYSPFFWTQIQVSKRDDQDALIDDIFLTPKNPVICVGRHCNGNSRSLLQRYAGFERPSLRGVSPKHCD